MFFMIAQFFMNFSDYYVSTWADSENHLNSSSFKSLNTSAIDELKINRLEKHKRYSILVVTFLFMMCIRSIVYYICSVRSSYKLHNMILNSVISTKIRFFDLNPVGRLINRFSKDVAVLDEILPVTLFEFFTTSMWVLGILISAIYINYLIAIFVVPLSLLFIYARRYYLPTSNDLKRIDGIFRSPVLVAVTNTLMGITTIRASQKSQILKEEFQKHLDNNNRAHLMYMHVQRWFQLRLDLIACTYSAACVITSILAKTKLGLTSGQIGLLLTYCLNLTSIFQWCIRQSCEVENLMTSVERLLEYVSLPNENDSNNKNKKKNKSNKDKENKKKKDNKLNKKIYKINEDEEVKIISNNKNGSIIENSLLKNHINNIDDNNNEKIKPPKEWPTKGEIIFDNVSFSYDENLPDVLKELSFKINPGEKIGIVGRTGAGKSSIIQTLFRMAEPSGNILIDDINIKDIDLNELRSKISIIPVFLIIFKFKLF